MEHQEASVQKNTPESNTTYTPIKLDFNYDPDDESSISSTHSQETSP